MYILSLLLVAPLAIHDDVKDAKAQCHGTAVEFVSDPKAAAKLAEAQRKLVMVLHVSGHFEDPAFT